MTNYARARLSYVVASNDDYNPADHRIDETDAETTPVHVIKGTVTVPVSPASAVTLHDISGYTTVRALMVVNKSTTDVVNVDYESATGAAGNQVPSADWCRITDVDTGTNPSVQVPIGGSAAEIEFAIEVTT